MATPQKPAAKAAASENTTDTGAEVQTTPIEQDVAQPTPPAPAPELQEQADPRASALAALVNGTAEPVIPEDTPVVVDDSEVLDFGGRSKAVVLFSRYNQIVDGLFKQARKGAVIKTDAESLKRGERIGALKKLEG